MKLAIMQPYFMPYIGYFQAIAAVDTYVLYDYVSYIKKGWINRNRINVINKGPVYITVPVSNASSNVYISEVRIDNSITWNKQILNLIYYNYKKSKYFNNVFPLIEKCLSAEYGTISKLNFCCITEICKYLELQTNVVLLEDTQYVDFENVLFESDINAHERMRQRITYICEQFNANIYINAIGGQELYDKDEFKQNGVDLYFVKTDEIKYRQFKDDAFEPNLSIIDVLMHNGKEGTKKLLNEYTLI